MKTKILIQSSKIVSKSQEHLIHKAYRVNREFFGFDLSKLDLVIAHTAAEWKKFSRYYYFPHANGLVLLDGQVIIKSPKFAKKTSSNWYKIVVHEINHAFWIYLRRVKFKKKYNPWSPIWLVEGLACFVAKNDVIMSKAKHREALKNTEIKNLFPYRYRANLFATREDLVFYYSHWYYYLQERYSGDPEGLRRLISLVANCSSKSEVVQLG